MHDPMTVAFELKIPIRRYQMKPGGTHFWHHVYVATVWHVDPEVRGDDDSCRWFMDGRPWWQHPRYHLRHLKVQIHVVQSLKRWLFSTCTSCGKGFTWGYAPISYSWGGKGPQWFESEKNVYHHECTPQGEFAK